MSSFEQEVLIQLKQINDKLNTLTDMVECNINHINTVLGSNKYIFMLLYSSSLNEKALIDGVIDERYCLLNPIICLEKDKEKVVGTNKIEMEHECCNNFDAETFVKGHVSKVVCQVIDSGIYKSMLKCNMDKKHQLIRSINSHLMRSLPKKVSIIERLNTIQETLNNIERMDEK